MAKKRRAQAPTKQTIVRRHSDWMRLIERSGPFLSMPVLLDAFPQGLFADDRENRVQLRQAYETWQTDSHDVAVHRAWIKYVLTHTLRLPVEQLIDTGHIPQNLSVRVDVHHETLAPDIAFIEPEHDDGNQTTPATSRMIVMIVPPEQALDKKLPGKTWAASPQTRISDLIRGCNDQGITFGLLTNGQQWMLVYSKQGETASFTTWYANLWFDETITLRAFRDLLSFDRFAGDPEYTLDKLFERSADDQHEVTDQLGLQVRDAIETLVSAIDEIDLGRKRKLLTGFSEEQLYEACVTVMMRLVFLFFAEERRLLPVKEQFYEQNYSLHGLLDRLQSQKASGEEIMEQEFAGWCRLLALFRAIHGGVQHDDMQLHAYGSSLFDPDRFPFLEGRPQGTKWRELESQPLPINDRTLLHVLEALKLLEVRGIGGGQRITRLMSFRELDVEDIGHIYESLLDHTAKRAKGHVLGLVGAKGKEPELSLVELERQAKQGREALVEYLYDETGKTKKSIEKLLDAANEQPRGDSESASDKAQATASTTAPAKTKSKKPTKPKFNEARLLSGCGNDQAFLAQVKPFAHLIRANRSGEPIIISDGSVYVTEGTDRRSSGTHYTPRSLTEPIVQHTLEPLVYEGPAEGKPQDEWKLKTPAEILELNICDMACGSGAFLVQACRYMAERLVEAWQHIEALVDDSQTDIGNTVVGSVEAVEMVVESNPQYATSKTVRRPRITPLGEVSKNDRSEELIPLDPAERMVYARRIVADRCLYGVDVNPLAVEMGKLSLWLLTLAKDKPFTFLNHAIRWGDSLVGLRDIEQLRHFSMKPNEDDAVLFSGPIENSVDDAIGLRIQLEGMPAISISDIKAKAHLLRQSEDKLARMRCAADLLVAAIYWNENDTAVSEAIRHAAVVSGHYVERGSTAEFEEKAMEARNGQRTFHWPLEFPEVFDRNGFDAFVGNPPFMGGQKITGSFGVKYREFVTSTLARGAKGSADLCVYFMLRCTELLTNGGVLGLLATKTISQGESKSIGLEQIASGQNSIIRAMPSTQWPGFATVEIAQIWIAQGEWSGRSFIDGAEVDTIPPSLSKFQLPTCEIKKLSRNANSAFQGTIVLGKGFVLTPDQADILIEENSDNTKVIFPYLIGRELNNNPEQQPQRRVINFRDWPLNPVKSPSDYSGRYASDFPECVKIVEELVKPDRQKLIGRNTIGTKRGTYWWRFGSDAKSLYNAIENNERVLLKTKVSNTWAFCFVPNGYVYDQALIVFKTEDYGEFALLQSAIHFFWADREKLTMRTDMQYVPTRCYETFPFPDSVKQLNQTGVDYHNARQQLMASTQKGLTKTYADFHDPTNQSKGIAKLRELQIKLDNLVSQTYGWDDLELHHSFVETKLGNRFTLSEANRFDILSRLILLNKKHSSVPSSKQKKSVRRS